MLFNGALALGLRFPLMWENKMLDEKYGFVDLQKNDEEVVKNSGPKFRYIL
jgi:hypothetical protein